MTLSLPDTSPAAPGVLNLSGMAGLTHLGVIRATGEDAAHFLQGQLTQDVLSLGLSEARLAAFCNAKGRMQASFVVFRRSDDELLLLCHRDILAATLKRLSMFVLRAKARLTDATEDFRLCGLVDGAIELIAGRSGTAWAKADFGSANIVFTGSGRAQPCVVVRTCHRTGTRRSSHGPRHLALAGGAVRHRDDQPADCRGLRAADAQLRVGGRREL